MSLHHNADNAQGAMSSANSATQRLLAEFAGIRVTSKDQLGLQRYIQGRMRNLGLTHESQYCDRLRLSYRAPRPTEEWNQLIHQVTNGESYFFRDPGQLKVIGKTLLPEIISRRRKAFRDGLIDHLYLNLWSAGCSTGEEPYSLAILLKELLLDFEDWRIHLIATDINPQSITKAKMGRYRDWSLRQIDPRYRLQYFKQVGADWQIAPLLQTPIEWDILNLNNPLAIANRIPRGSMDLILCRNVFIYFEPTTIAKILQQFHAALDREGSLLVGHAELEHQDLRDFSLRYEPMSVVYQRAPQEKKQFCIHLTSDGHSRKR